MPPALQIPPVPDPQPFTQTERLSVDGLTWLRNLRTTITTLINTAFGAAGTPRPLGGSRQISVREAAGIQDAIDYLDIPVDWTRISGYTVRAQVEVRTDDPSTSVTPSIANVTDGTSDAGVACVAIAADYSGANQKQTITITVPVVRARKLYRLKLTPSDANNGVYGIGYLEIV